MPETAKRVLFDCFDSLYYTSITDGLLPAGTLKNNLKKPDISYLNALNDFTPAASVKTLAQTKHKEVSLKRKPLCANINDTLHNIKIKHQQLVKIT